MMRKTAVLNREVEATEIPYGGKFKLDKGTVVTVTQALGGSLSVMTDYGDLARVEGKDADALGEEFVALANQKPNTDLPLEEQVREVLKTVYDPEIPVDVLELGLIYGTRISDLPEGGHRVDVQMTLTAPGCGIGDVLKAEIEQKLAELPGVKAAEVEIVLDPPWDPSRMSDAARLATGIM